MYFKYLAKVTQLFMFDDSKEKICSFMQLQLNFNVYHMILFNCKEI